MLIVTTRLAMLLLAVVPLWAQLKERPKEPAAITDGMVDEDEDSNKTRAAIASMSRSVTS